MKNLIPLLTCILFFASSNVSLAINYNSTGDATWGASGFPANIPMGDTVFIHAPHTITTSANINISGALIIDTLSTLSGNHEIDINVGGALHNSGVVNITDEMHIDGSLFNTSFVNVEKLHCDGYMCNAGIVELEPNEKFDFHGGEIECCGIILADIIKIHKNTGVNLNGNPAGVMDCQTLCGTDQLTNPTFENPVSEAEFLANSEFSESQINPANTTLCSISPLSVELVSFEGNQIEGGYIELSWTTESETNNDYFTVFQSFDGLNWNRTGTVIGSGTTTESNRYSLIDEDKTPGGRYYRLSQTDFDGRTEFFEVIHVALNHRDAIICYPNPSHDYLNIQFTEPVHKTDITIFGLEGRSVLNQVELLKINNNTLKINVQHLNPGVYYVSYKGNQSKFIVR